MTADLLNGLVLVVYFLSKKRPPVVMIQDNRHLTCNDVFDLKTKRSIVNCWLEKTRKRFQIAFWSTAIVLKQEGYYAREKALPFKPIIKRKKFLK